MVPGTQAEESQILTALRGLRIVVLSYGHEERFTSLIQSLLDDHGVNAGQILVVHNPYDADDRWVPAVPEGVQRLVTGSNRGYAGGMNAGLQHQLQDGAAYVLLLTHDAQLGPHSVRRMLEAAESHPELGVLGPVLVDAQVNKLHSTGVHNGWTGPRHRKGALAPGEVNVCDAIDGSVVLARAEAITSAGQFREDFFMYYEETEFCLRVRSAGMKIGVVGGAESLTEPGSARRPGVYGFLMTRNGLAYVHAQHRSAARRSAVSAGLVAMQLYTALPKPGGRRFRSRAGWGEARLHVQGIRHGVGAFRAGRWGPPPAVLLQRSDVRR